MNFDSLTKRKYEYKIDETKYDNYQLDDQAKNMSNSELLEYQQRKVRTKTRK